MPKLRVLQYLQPKELPTPFTLTLMRKLFVVWYVVVWCAVKDYCSASQIERARQLQQLWDEQVQASVTSSSSSSASQHQPTWNTSSSYQPMMLAPEWEDVDRQVPPGGTLQTAGCNGRRAVCITETNSCVTKHVAPERHWQRSCFAVSGPTHWNSPSLTVRTSLPVT